MDSTEVNSSLATSALLFRLKHVTDAEEISVQQLLDVFKISGFSFFLIIFSSITAVIPGVSAVLAFVLIFFAIQLLLGYPTPWVPSWLSRRKIPRKHLTRVADFIIPHLKRIEHLIKPRLFWLTARKGERVIGATTLFSALAILIPGPFTNFLPSIGIIVMSIGLMERDGMMVLIGMITAIIGSIIVIAAYVGIAILALNAISG